MRTCLPLSYCYVYPSLFSACLQSGAPVLPHYFLVNRPITSYPRGYGILRSEGAVRQSYRSEFDCLKP